MNSIFAHMRTLTHKHLVGRSMFKQYGEKSSVFVFSYGQRCHSHLSYKANSTNTNSGSHGHVNGSYGRHSRAAHGHHGISDAPLAMLPFSAVLRTLTISAVSSSPLLPLSLRVMAALAYSTNPLLSPDYNPVIRYSLRSSLYAQFCAGSNESEVRAKIAQLKRIGFSGVVLAYAKEVDSSAGSGSPENAEPGEESESIIGQEIAPWTERTLETVRLTDPGDFAALKFSGAGRLAIYRLSNCLPPSPYLSRSIEDICQHAHERGVRLLFDGEQDMLQEGIDAWTIRFARKYNSHPGRATIFGTYQAYKKSTPKVLSRHLAEAQKSQFTLGVKLVRGAYLLSDHRCRICNTKADTDACYDGSAASIITRQWNSTIKGAGEFPHVSIMLATHNATSIRRGHAICAAGEAKSEVCFAQLQGMADEIGCELVEQNEINEMAHDVGAPSVAALPVYKYMAWGTTAECMQYLLRRAQENREAIDRTRDDRDAMWAEFIRRIKSAFHKV